MKTISESVMLENTQAPAPTVSLAVRKIIARMFTTALGMVMLFQAGCAALLVGGGAATGVGTYAYVKGELKATEDASLDRAWTATVETLEELKYPVTRQQKDALSGNLTARTAEDKKVTIQLKSQSEKLTEIKIRVGTFGDQALSLAIMDKIKSKV